MKKQATNVLKFFFFLSIGILLIWLALRNKSEKEINDIIIAIKQANYFWLFASLVVSGLSHYFRALRWKLLLKPLGHQTKTSNTFFAVMVGYLANFALPRLGEVTRCGILTKYEKVPFTEGFGTVIAERALDFICLVLLFFATLGLEFDRISGITNKFIFTPLSGKFNALIQKQVYVIITVIVLLIFIAAFYYFRKKIQSLVSAKVLGFMYGLWDGLKSIKNVDKPFWFITHTILIWLMYILQVYVCFFAFSETANLSLMVAVVIVVFGSIGVITVPGGTGAYQIIVIYILTNVYIISSNPAEAITVANAFAWSVWTSQFILILSLGLISLILLAVLNKDVKNS